MKKTLIDGSLKQYRANLHCHSTISDGCKTPEEIKRDYMAHGYSVVAYTDHNVYVNHNDLSDESFVALNGYELDVSENEAAPKTDRRTCHLCYIALEKDNDISVCFNKDKYIWGNAKEYADAQHYIGSPDYERIYSPEGVNDMIKQGTENGFFVTYNHPTWSLEAYPQYSQYRGMNAMEIQNFGCVIVGYDDDNGHCCDDLLNLGNSVYCIATDDNHNAHPDDSPDCDSYGGYTMISASALEYSAIAKSLSEGRFYSSTGNYRHTGPEIESLVYEDGMVKIRTSPARSICIMHNKRCCRIKNAAEGENVTEAQFKVEDAIWFRLTVTDNYGFKAYTNAYFIEELNK